MADYDLGRARGRIEIDGRDALSSMAKVETGLDQTKGKMERLAPAMLATGKKLSKFVTLPLIGAGVAGIKMAADIDTGLREVNSLLGDTGKAAEKNFGEMKKEVKDLSKELGIAQKDIVPGLYQAISAGVPKENVFDFMRVASKAAIAGVTDTETAIDGITTVVNAFGLEAADAESVADSMFTAVKLGKTTFEELSASLFQVAPAAAAVGLSIDEVNAGLAALTAAGVPTSVATTQMRAAIVELTQGAGKAGKAFTEVSGKSFPEFIKSGGTLQEALAMMRVEADKNGESLLDMFGSVEAGQAALALTGTAAEAFGNNIDAMAKKTGAVNTAFEEIEKGPGRKFEKSMVALKNAAIELGNVLLPFATKFITFAGKLIDKFSGLSEGQQKLIVTIGLLVAAVGPILIIGSKLIKMFGLISTAFKALAVAFAFNPFLLLIAAIVALVALVIFNWDKIKAATLAVWNWIKEHIGTIIRVIIGIATGGLSELVLFFVKNWDKIKKATGAALEAVVNFFKELPAKLAHWVGFAIGKVVRFFWDLPGNIWDALKAATVKMALWILDAIAWAKRVGPEIVERVVNFFKELPGKIWHWLVETLAAIGRWVIDMKDKAIQGGKDFVDSLISFIKNLPERVAEIGKNIVAKIKEMITNAFKAMKELGGKLWEGFKKGLGIGSPSYLEEAMDRIVNNLVKGAQQVRSRVHALQRYGISEPSIGGVSLATAASGTAAAGAQSNVTVMPGAISMTVGSMTKEAVPEVEAMLVRAVDALRARMGR